MASMKRSSDDESEEPPCKMSRRDDDDDGSKSGGRASRIRKKSAKVLEMEEFEEIEKKQFSKKTDPKGKAAATPPSTGAKKAKGKTGPDDIISPVAATLGGDAVSVTGGIVTQGGSLIQESPASPVKASTKQAIGAKVREAQQQGSVIKLLLSSPAIPTTPSISRNVITKTSPPVPVSSPGVTVTPTTAPTATKKASSSTKAQVKSEPLLKQEPGTMMMMGEDLMSVPVKSELMDPQAAHLMLSASLAPDAMSTPQAFIKSEPELTPTSEGMGSLKLKLLMSPKDIETDVPSTDPIPSMFGTNPDETDGANKVTSGSSKTKKKPAPKKKKPAGEKAGKQSATKSAAEQMPNLAALVSTPKLQKGVKEEKSLNLSDTMDTSMSDTSLDMSSIVESALDMEEEAALVIAEGGTAPSKPKKKKASGGSRKKSKAAAAAMELAGLDSDEALSAQPEGDLAMLAAKVQRSAGGAGGKKKVSKKSLELQESALDKKKRPSRRAPTAYMLYCNSQRPKVVAESPGIDFAQISRTLGVMWQCLSKKEKMMWRRKSKKLAGKGSTLISTGKGNKKGEGSNAAAAAAMSATQPAARPAASKSKSSPAAAALPALAGDDTPQSPVKGFGIEPIDIAAHLKLLGESLSIIGNRLQEHKGLIAVQGSLSVLLDSMLCACGPLLALTHQVPGLDGCSEATHARTLDSVAYIMPGL